MALSTRDLGTRRTHGDSVPALAFSPDPRHNSIVSEPYALEPEPTPPSLWGRTVVCESLDDSIGALAADLLHQAMACVNAFGSFHLGVSGDPMLEPVYRRLMYDPPLRSLPWAKTHLWLVDEVAGEEPTRFGVVDELLAMHSGVPRSQVHRIRPDVTDPAGSYQRELQDVLEWRERGHDRLDMIVLALADAEPNLALTGLRSDAQPLVAQDAGRIAMTPRLVNASRLIGIFAPGVDCRTRLLDLQKDAASPWRSIRPTGGSLHWYLDREACVLAQDA